MSNKRTIWTIRLCIWAAAAGALWFFFPPALYPVVWVLVGVGVAVFMLAGYVGVRMWVHRAEEREEQSRHHTRESLFRQEQFYFAVLQRLKPELDENNPQHQELLRSLADTHALLQEAGRACVDPMQREDAMRRLAPQIRETQNLMDAVADGGELEGGQLREDPAGRTRSRADTYAAIASMSIGADAEEMRVAQKARYHARQHLLALKQHGLFLGELPPFNNDTITDLQDVAACLYQAADAEPKQGGDEANGDWLTVTDAAKRFMEADVVFDLTLENARSRISEACRRGIIKTNGEKGRGRRINPDSLSAWFMAVRERELKE